MQPDDHNEPQDDKTVTDTNGPVTANQQDTTAPAKEPTNAGLIVLQWLTYAFWGWTVLALSFLTASVVADFIDPSSGDGFTSYGIAAILVLLPLSYVLDSFYSKKEPAKKVGAETWVMIIHAVIFAIVGIGALIAGVIALVVLFTSSGGSKGAQITLVSSLIIAAFYAVTFLRTLNPAAFRWIQTKYKFIMLATVGVIALLGLVGPVARERATRDDRLIANNISAVSNAVNSYAMSNDKLPADLKSLSLRGDARTLVSRGLVDYKPEGSAPVTDLNSSRSTSDFVKSIGTTNNSSFTKPVYRYQLCVEYKAEQLNNSSYSTPEYGAEEDGYASYLSAYEHPKGEVCYKLKTRGY